MIAKLTTSILKKIKFAFSILGRAFVVMFRRRQGIELLRLEYFDEHLFENSYIIIQYRFRNALWYRFGSHITLEKEIKIFNLKKIEKEFNLLVYGLFRKKIYRLKFDPQLTLETSNFKTVLQNFDANLQLWEPQIVRHKFVPRITKIETMLSKIERIEPKLKINNQPYKQTDFI
jgi:hypothetical protein